MWLGIFSIQLKYFPKKSYLMIHWEKQNIMLYILNFRERGSPHAHSFIWIFNASNIPNETAYTGFIEKTINAQLPDHLKDPEL